MDEKRKQVAQQCRAVAHLATALAQVNSDYAQIFESGGVGAEVLIEQVGSRTANHMELLGDMLNGMDAATDADDWLIPIFEEAHRLWTTT